MSNDVVETKPKADVMTQSFEGEPTFVLDAMHIMQLLPHRYPFLLVDRILGYPGKCGIGIKNVTINEPFFPGHFPGNPVMPGVLIVEAMAQTAGALVLKNADINPADVFVYFLGVDKARFRKPVLPGDTLHIHTFHEQTRGHVWKYRSQAYVGSDLVSDAEYKAMIVFRKDKNI